MGAYILRRLLLVIPTLIGVMVINFTLVQFVPGGPVEQIIASMQGEGDVTRGFTGAGQDATAAAAAGRAAKSAISARAACRPSSSPSSRPSSALTSRRWNGSC